ncbi:GH1 family beta-glucosidase [Shewanella amazonensis]|uniref:Beta-glucosidase n=1 Tax=Shewanella amazonensis (strain ATCC BAA-1098 / SB2B) TaxID=326297 RepID=A1S5F3_SHEAM|nr:GH1 family beta-glucosidase [Shewanella amazonensis]ABL99609.1 Beta-glucosidase [Shewanella amazonensis SB2B]
MTTLSHFTLPGDSVMMQKDFLFGVATASFQIEGDAEHRQPCIWDTFCDTPGKIADGSNGQVACDHVKLWRDDVDLIASLGVDAYRLSISWGRVLHPDGSVNQRGMDFYINLLDELGRRGINVFVTLYHWDLPQHLEDKGGWLNRDTAVAFANYAAIVANALGNRVYAYSTLNEPFCSAFLGYEAGIHAPGHKSRQQGRTAAHNLLLAHGMAMTEIRREAPEAKAGIVLNFSPAYPYTSSAGDANAARLAHEYHNTWYLMPLMEGRYPDIINQLEPHERPVVEPGDMDIISTPIDYLGINYYTRNVYRAGGPLGFEEVRIDNVPRTAMDWEICPQAFTDLLTGLAQEFNLPPIYITENGAAEDDAPFNGTVHDPMRLDYLQSHLLAVHQAIERGVDIKGYFAWSLMDNFEWAEGYRKRFGLVYVDYGTQQRILKSSAKAYQGMLAIRQEASQQ